jgi:nicotinate (nicotinamide) nucleotide adenylyltransferase
VDERDHLTETIARIQESSSPAIGLVRQSAAASPRRVGVFASSFNPVTCAHLELMNRSAQAFDLDDVLAIAGVANADKTHYDCSLEERLSMLLLAGDEAAFPIGVSSHAYFVDMIEALEAIYPNKPKVYFILGFDTFSRVVDRNDLYSRRYHRQFRDSSEALCYLVGKSHLVVAGRAGAGFDNVNELIGAKDQTVRDRVHYIDLPVDIAERSSTEVRERVRMRQSITDLVPLGVERFVLEHGIYNPEKGRYAQSRNSGDRL